MEFEKINGIKLYLNRFESELSFMHQRQSVLVSREQRNLYAVAVHFGVLKKKKELTISGKVSNMIAYRPLNKSHAHF